MLVLRRTAVASLSVLAVVGASLAATETAHAVDPGSAVVISEVYGGGGNSGAPYRNDFVELYNKGPLPVSVSGWSVQYSSSTGTSWTATPLTGSIAPGAYYLVAEAAGSNTAAAPLPAADATGTIAMSGTNGKIALASSSAALTCGASCSTASGVLDLVGYGSANDAAGHPTPALSNSTSANRKITPFTNTGDNANDFTIEEPTPKAAAPTPPPPLDCSATPTPSECVPGPLSIQDIQGPGFLSPQRGNTVERVPGVVTAVRATGSSRGFWIQQTNPDAGRPSSSSGIFVFTSTTPVSVGDAVLVTGKVTDYYILSSGETLATTANLSTTEITPTTVTTASTGNALPAPLLLTPTTVPGTYAPTVTGGNNIETIDPVNPTNSALEFWEAHEGMLVQVDNARVVGPGKPQYGEIYVTTKPADLATPRGGNYLASYADTPTGRLLVSPVNGSVPSANVGDLLVGPTVGPVDWSTFGGYDIAATQLGTYQDNHLTGSTAGPAAPDQLSIATYNVENLAPGDPADKYARLGAGVVTNLRSPDVITLEEIQDNSGSTNDGTVAADDTLNRLTAAISTAGGPAYSWSQINPVDGQDGGQPGGNIRVAFLYNTDRVTLAPGTAGDSTTAVSATTAPDGTAALSVNPGRVDPTNEAWTSSRKPLAGEFLFQGKKVIVVANHFNSKGGDQSADGRFQPPNRSSEVQRGKQATVLNGFVKQVLAADPGANVVLAGDFNDYQFSAPVQTLTDNGTTLTDLINTLPANERYTYVYNGVSQVLDHIFLSKAVTDVQYDVVHVNSEFSAQSSDHDPQVVRIRPSTRQGTLALDPASVVVGSPTQVKLAGWYPGRDFTVALDGSSAGHVTTDAAGGGTFTLGVPAGTALGAHQVSVTSPDGATASTTLTVRPVPVQQGSVQLSPPKVKPGKSVKLHLRDWQPRATLSVSLDGGVTLATVTVDNGGNGKVDIDIPTSTSTGQHQVVVTATDLRTVSTPLEVN